MIPYVVAALFPCIVGYVFDWQLKIDKKTRYKQKRWLALFIAALPMFLLIAFRSQWIGADTDGYLNHFMYIDAKPWGRIFENTRMEYGYIVFVKILGIFTDSPLVYQVICATIYCLAVTTFANELQKSNFTFLYFFATLGIYTFMFTGTRQCLAMSICLFSYVFIKKRQPIPFALLILLAFFFHKSSILFIAAYLIYTMPLGVVSVAIYTAIGAMAYLNIGVIQEWFNDQLDYEYGVEDTGNGYIFTAVILLITAFSMLMIFNYKKLTRHSRGLINVSFITLVFWVLRIATRVAERPSYYFMFFTAAMLAYAISAIKDRDQRIVVGGIIGVLSMALYIYRFTTNFSTLVPYMFYW